MSQDITKKNEELELANKRKKAEEIYDAIYKSIKDGLLDLINPEKAGTSPAKSISNEVISNIQEAKKPGFRVIELIRKLELSKTDLIEALTNTISLVEQNQNGNAIEAGASAVLNELMTLPERPNNGLLFLAQLSNKLEQLPSSSSFSWARKIGSILNGLLNIVGVNETKKKYDAQIQAAATGYVNQTSNAPTSIAIDLEQLTKKNQSTNASTPNHCHVTMFHHEPHVSYGGFADMMADPNYHGTLVKRNGPPVVISRQEQKTTTENPTVSHSFNHSSGN